MEWISVDERLPTADEIVGDLVVWVDPDGIYGYREDADWSPEHQVWFGEGLATIEGVTHWMEIDPPVDNSTFGGKTAGEEEKEPAVTESVR